jgi:hypothetical protein
MAPLLNYSDTNTPAIDRRARKPRPNVQRVGRKTFIQWFKKNYHVSQRVTFLGPPGRGKTKLATDLLAVVISPDCKVVILHGKIEGRDHVITETAKKLNLRIIHEWPPGYDYRDRKRNGWILIPLDKPGANTKAENAILADHFGRAIHDNYQTNSKKPRITFIDESHQAQTDLKLRGDIEAPMMRGRPDNAVWNLIQRGRYVSYHCYEVEHLFIFYDSDTSNTQRYSEMGDTDPVYIREITETQLRTRELPSGDVISDCLYMNRSGYMCIVEMD